MTNRPPDKEPSCINCGGAGHWAIACPEPTRQVPAGLQGQRPVDERHRGGGKPGPKRHKGPIVNKYSPPAPAPARGIHAPFAPSYGGYSPPEPSYPPPGHAPHGHFGGPTPSPRPPPPPGPPPSYSPPPHLAGGSPHTAPPHGHPYGPPGSYATPPRPPPAPPYRQPTGYPGGPPPPPPPQPFPRQHQSQHQHQYYQQHPQSHHPHPPPPPPHYDYSPPQTHPYPQHPYPPPPPPPSNSASAGRPFHGQPPPAQPPAPGPSYMKHPPPGPPAHRSPTPQSSTSHGPPSLPSLPNIGGPGSLIRVLPPKPTVQVPPTDRGHGRRKDRNKSWRNKRNKDKHTPGTTKTNGEPTRKNEPKSASEVTKATAAEFREDGKAAGEHGAADSTKAREAKSDAGDVDATSKTSDKPEEGEILDEDPEWEWDEKTIFKQPEEVHLADAVAGPLPSEYTEHVLLPPAWNAKCITSKFVNPDNRSDFCRPVWETPLWDRYKNTVPFGSPRSARAPLTVAQLMELLGTRRSSENPGPRREPMVRSSKQSSPLDREREKYPEVRGRSLSRERPISPERRTQQKDRRPVIDSYRPNYELSRQSRSLSRGRRRRRSEGSAPRGQDSPGSPTPFFQLPQEDRSRGSSPESDLNSLENELLGLSPKSSSEDERNKADEKKIEEPKKRPNDDAIPKSKRRRVQVDSAFARRW